MAVQKTNAAGNHAVNHESGGSDEIDCTGLTGAGGSGLSPTLITNSGMSVWSQGAVAEYGAQYTVTAITAGVCTTTNTQGLIVGSVVKFDAGGTTGGKTYVVTAVVVNTSFTIHDTTITDATDVTGHEITIGCIAADTLCCDKWTKTSGVDTWRERLGTYTTGGSYYSLKVTGDGSAGTVQWSDGGQAALSQWYSRFAGRSVVFGCWVWCASANKARIGIVQSSGTTYSDYHSGGSSWEWLEVTVAIASNTTTFSIVLDAGTSTTAYFSCPQLSYGTVLGSGNYLAIPQEMIWLDVAKASTLFAGGAFSTALNTIYAQADSSLVIPITAKSVYARCQANDSGSAAGSPYLILYGLSAYAGIILWLQGQGNDYQMMLHGITSCANNAILYGDVNASGSGTIDITVNYTGVQL